MSEAVCRKPLLGVSTVSGWLACGLPFDAPFRGVRRSGSVSSSVVAMSTEPTPSIMQ